MVAPPKNYKDAEARKMAVGAFDILKKCQVFNELSECFSRPSMKSWEPPAVINALAKRFHCTKLLPAWVSTARAKLVSYSVKNVTACPGKTWNGANTS